MMNFTRPKVRKDWLVIAGRRTTAALFLILGAIGLTIIFKDPLPWILQYVDIKQPYILNSITAFRENLAVSASSSSVLILFGVLLFGRGIKDTPRHLVKAWRKATIWRNWITEKVEYLQAESGKWKAFFSALKAPYSMLRMMGLSPQMAATVLFAGSTVGGGVIVNETVLAERSFKAGDSGVYQAPLDTPVQYTEGNNTLRVDLGTVPIKRIEITDASFGTIYTGSALPTGETTAVEIGGEPAAENFTATRIEIGTFIFEKSRCKKITMDDMKIHTLIIRGNAADGLSIAPSACTTASCRMRSIGGGHHMAQEMVTTGGTYDRLQITPPTSATNGSIDELIVSNLYTKGGDCKLSAMDVGTMEISLNMAGAGDGFGASHKDFVISNTVQASNIINEDNIELSISEPATQ